MRRRLLVAVLLLMGITVVTGGGSATGSSSTPTVGTWYFCTAADQVGCIEHFEFENQSGTLVPYAALHEAQNAGVTVTARCFASGVAEGAPCVPPPSMGCGSAGTSFQFSVEPTPTENGQPRDKSAMNGRRFVIRLRTGDFDPVFTMGGRIDALKRTRLDSGLFTLEVEGRMQAVHGVETYSAVPMDPPSTYRTRLSAFLKTAKATSVSYWAYASVYPRAFLQSTSVDLGGQCINMPFVDAYADMNGNGTTLSWVPSRPTDAVASTIKLEIHGPHYLPESNGNDDKIVPARIRFFLPNAFFTDAGYPDTSKFDAASLRITAYGDQVSTPVLERRSDGIMVDYGISHFSAPDPVVTILRYGRSLADIPAPTVTTTTSTVAPVSTTPVASVVPYTRSVTKGKKMTVASAVATARLVRTYGSTVALRVTRGGAYCRASSSGITALRKGTCGVSVTVKYQNKRRASRTITVKVT